MNTPPLKPDTSMMRILVVDDIADNYLLIQAILELEGYQVEVADNGYFALEMIEFNPPDLILLDVMMPGLNGFEITQRLRQNNCLPLIPILLVTADKEIEESFAFDMGANGLLYKPIDPDLLLEQVRAILNPVNSLERVFSF